MDLLGLVEVPVWLLMLLLFFLLVFGYSYYKQSTFTRLGIPGPRPVPFFGTYGADVNTKGLVKVDAEMVKKYGRIVGLYACNMPQLLITDPEIVKQVLVKEFVNFTDRPAVLPVTKPFSEFVSVANGEHWRFLRGTISPTFTTGKLRAMEPMVNDCVARLLTNLEESASEESVDVKPLFGSYVVDTIGATAFGMDVDSQRNPDHPFVQYARKLARLEFQNFTVLMNMMFPVLAPVIRLFGHSVLNKEMTDFFVEVTKKALADRRLHKSDHKDFLQIMVDSQRDVHADTTPVNSGSEYDKYKARGITDNEILANALVFFLAGYDTSGNVMVWMAYCLATTPDVQDKLLREIDEQIGQEKPTYDSVMKLTYLDMVLNETLRLYPPVSRVSRLCLKDIEICGLFIPKGMDVNFPIYAMQRDPEFWTDPEKFDPERFSPENKSSITQYAFLPFGHGPRNCIGMRLALMQVKLAMVSVLQKFTFTTTHTTQIPPKFDTRSGVIFLSPVEGMWLKVKAR